jgi:hypothetical protein
MEAFRPLSRGPGPNVTCQRCAIRSDFIFTQIADLTRASSRQRIETLEDVMGKKTKIMYCSMQPAKLGWLERSLAH